MDKPERQPLYFHLLAGILLLGMAYLAAGAALRESVSIDEVAHVGAGLSYLQKFDLRLNEEHPPLAKMLAAVPLVLRGTHADYSHVSWTASRKFLPHAYLGQWVFGEWVLARWNDPAKTLAWARFPMLLLTLLLGWVIYRYARRLGGSWGGLLCLSAFVSTPVFLTFGPLVLTDVAVTLFALLTLWWFAEVWREPSRANVTRFAIYLAGALLSKFSAGLLFFAFGLFALSTRWRPIPGQPTTKPEAKVWRRARWRATFKGTLWAAVVVYVVYFIFSWNQTTDVLYLLGGHSAAWVPVRRLLMPPWLYLRGILMLAVTFSRPAYILGHHYPHGAVIYFPALFVLKSTLGFLGLLASALALSVFRKGSDGISTSAVAPDTRIHWRVLWVALVLFVAASVFGHFDVSYRHFTIPVVLTILLLAPVPRLLEQLRLRTPPMARAMTAVVAVLAVSSLVVAVRAYPHYFPYVNALSMGKPGYALVSDSNLDWNQAMPEVKAWADQHHVEKLQIDQYGFNDPSESVPGAAVWNCQRPTAADAGQWVVVSADMILDTHNCGWLLQYPHESLAAGGMYAFHLPSPIPPAGDAGGPPLPADQREFAGFPQDVRLMFVGFVRDPNTLVPLAEKMAADMQAQMEARKAKKGGR